AIGDAARKRRDRCLPGAWLGWGRAGIARGRQAGAGGAPGRRAGDGGVVQRWRGISGGSAPALPFPAGHPAGRPAPCAQGHVRCGARSPGEGI
ncbi:MAG: hypothetical protein AVDCRST_MAG89-4955, partial [uncultured Gemmatimonadetes bacterium]